MSLIRKVGIALAVLQAPVWAYVAYMRFVYTPPAPVPCEQGMTLMPGQECVLTLIIPHRRDINL